MLTLSYINTIIFCQENKDESESADISVQTPIVIPTANVDCSPSFGNCSNAATTCETCCICDETENCSQNTSWYSIY